jgi:hypothetical protein
MYPGLLRPGLRPHHLHAGRGRSPRLRPKRSTSRPAKRPSIGPTIAATYQRRTVRLTRGGRGRAPAHRPKIGARLPTRDSSRANRATSSMPTPTSTSAPIRSFKGNTFPTSRPTAGDSWLTYQQRVHQGLSRQHPRPRGLRPGRGRIGWRRPSRRTTARWSNAGADRILLSPRHSRCSTIRRSRRSRS